MDQLNLKRDEFHGEWNYSLIPGRKIGYVQVILNYFLTLTDSTITGPGTVGLISGGGTAFGTYTVNGS